MEVSHIVYCVSRISHNRGDVDAILAYMKRNPVTEEERKTFEGMYLDSLLRKSNYNNCYSNYYWVKEIIKNFKSICKLRQVKNITT